MDLNCKYFQKSEDVNLIGVVSNDFTDKHKIVEQKTITMHLKIRQTNKVNDLLTVN